MIGERMRQARLRAGLTQEKVVRRLSKLGVSLTKAGLSKYERAQSTPSASLLLNLAKVLGVRSNYFLEEPKVNVQWLAFRKLSTLSQRRQERIKAKATEVIEAQVWLQEKLYPRRFHRFPQSYKAQTPDDAENAATMLRKRWSLDDLPMGSVAETIEDHGGIIVEHSEARVGFHGLSGWANRRYPVIVTSSEVPDDRRRFSLAHELGHLVMDCGRLDEKKQEMFAHRFAAAFIVPRAVAQRELGEQRRSLSFEELALLKRKHGLSMQAWMYRARDLRIIGEGHFRTLLMRFSRNGWRKREPVEFLGRERPTRLQQMALRALAEGLITPEKAEHLCPGCTEKMEDEPPKLPPVYLSALEVMKLPKSERRKVLAAAAHSMEKQYRTNRELTDFEALGEGALYDESV